MNNEPILCACGCGHPVKISKYPSQPQARFINRHQHKGENNGNYKGGKLAKSCGVCGATFYVSPSLVDVRQTCGKDKCFRTWQGRKSSARKGTVPKVKSICPGCGNEFERYPSQIKNKRRVFCSEACHNKSRMEDEGSDKHWGWQGGTSRWKRKQIILRDNGACVVCGLDFFVDVHHITARSKGGTDEFHNLVCLCPNHHKMAHMGLVDLEPYRNYTYQPPCTIKIDPDPNMSPARLEKNRLKRLERRNANR